MKKTFKCRTCGKVHTFAPYVFAHWNELLVHTCDRCDAQHEVLRGNVKQIRKGTKPTQP